MNTESSYIYSGSHEDDGLGRIRPVILNRNLPTTHAPTVRSRSLIQPKRIPLPKPIVRPRSLPTLRPVIDKNPVPPPKRLTPVSRKPATRQSSNATNNPASTPKPTAAVTVQKTANNKSTSGSGGILDGTIKVGGLEVDKKQAAVAGSATAVGLLVWKLLF